mgnify:CR=1 FL=1
MIRHIIKPIFSGHESFACKSHWLKRGDDFVIAGKNFNDDETVMIISKSIYNEWVEEAIGIRNQYLK